MNDSVRLVEFVKHQCLEQFCLGEEVLHFEVALLMQFVWGNPYESHLLEWQVATALQFLGESGEHFACHHRLSFPSWSFQHYLPSVAIKTQHIDGRFHQLLHCLLL